MLFVRKDMFMLVFFYNLTTNLVSSHVYVNMAHFLCFTVPPCVFSGFLVRVFLYRFVVLQLFSMAICCMIPSSLFLECFNMRCVFTALLQQKLH